MLWHLVCSQQYVFHKCIGNKQNAEALTLPQVYAMTCGSFLSFSNFNEICLKSCFSHAIPQSNIILFSWRTDNFIRNYLWGTVLASSFRWVVEADLTALIFSFPAFLTYWKHHKRLHRAFLDTLRRLHCSSTQLPDPCCPAVLGVSSISAQPNPICWDPLGNLSLEKCSHKRRRHISKN